MRAMRGLLYATLVGCSKFTADTDSTTPEGKWCAARTHDLCWDFDDSTAPGTVLQPPGAEAAPDRSVFRSGPASLKFSLPTLAATGVRGEAYSTYAASSTASRFALGFDLYTEIPATVYGNLSGIEFKRGSDLYSVLVIANPGGALSILEQTFTPPASNPIYKVTPLHTLGARTWVRIEIALEINGLGGSAPSGTLRASVNGTKTIDKPLVPPPSGFVAEQARVVVGISHVNPAGTERPPQSINVDNVTIDAK